MTTPSPATRNAARRRPDQPPQLCALCSRPFTPIWNQHVRHCSAACARLERQRAARQAERECGV